MVPITMTSRSRWMCLCAWVLCLVGLAAFMDSVPDPPVITSHAKTLLSERTGQPSQAGDTHLVRDTAAVSYFAHPALQFSDSSLVSEGLNSILLTSGASDSSPPKRS